MKTGFSCLKNDRKKEAYPIPRQTLLREPSTWWKANSFQGKTSLSLLSTRKIQYGLLYLEKI